MKLSTAMFRLGADAASAFGQACADLCDRDEIVSDNSALDIGFIDSNGSLKDRGDRRAIGRLGDCAISQ